MRPKRFIETVKQLRFPEMLDDGDSDRILDLYKEAIEHSNDRVLVGFRGTWPSRQDRLDGN